MPSSSILIFPPLLILSDSIKILRTNPKHFLSIYTLTILPLSLLLSTLFLLSQPLLAKISDEEHIATSVAQYATVTHYESVRLWRGILTDSLYLFAYKSAFFIPIYIFSLFALLTTVTSTALAVEGKCPDRRAAVLAVSLTWRRQLVTSLCVHILMGANWVAARVVLLAVWDTRARLVVWVGWVVLEVFVMAVLGNGMVVSVLEERFGMEALWAGWGLMEGRWFCGWSLAGLVLLAMAGIRLGFVRLMDRKDWMSRVEKVGLISLLGFVILWSYVVSTIFYCGCRRRVDQKVEDKPLPLL